MEIGKKVRPRPTVSRDAQLLLGKRPISTLILHLGHYQDLALAEMTGHLEDSLYFYSHSSSHTKW